MFKKISIFALLATVLLWSCAEEDSMDPVYNPSTSSGPSITAPSAGDAVVLKEEMASETAMTVEWSAANFSNINLAITYEVMMDKAGNDFATAFSLGTTTERGLVLTHEGLDQKVYGAGYPADIAKDFEIKVVARVTDDIMLESSPVTVSVTPYAIIVNYPVLNVPGAYQGWNPGGAEVIYTKQGMADETFEGFQYFESASTQFKYAKGDWSANWGDDGEDGTLEGDGANIISGDVGMYWLKVDLNALTHTYELTNWGVLGSATATGWDSDTDLTYDPATGYLTATMDLAAGEVKFRANDDWAINVGVDGNGKFLFGGDNIQVAEAGNYTVNLILKEAEYRYELIKN